MPLDQLHKGMHSVHITVCPFLQAARAASSAAIAAQQQAQPEASRDALPAFGSGIQFRPTKKVKQQGPSQCAQKTSPAPNLVLSDKDEDMRPASKPALVILRPSMLNTIFGCLYQR